MRLEAIFLLERRQNWTPKALELVIKKVLNTKLFLFFQNNSKENILVQAQYNQRKLFYYSLFSFFLNSNKRK